MKYFFKTTRKSLWLPFITLLAISSPAAVPQLIHYQGRMVVGGTNYTGLGEFKFSLISGAMNTNRTATARASVNLLTGGISVITVLDGGIGYRSAPSVAIDGGLFGGSGAKATATISGGSVVAIAVVDPGSGYGFNRVVVRIDPPPPALSVNTLWSNDGTGTLGLEPSDSVGLEVENGLYSVLLGNATLNNMTAIPSSVFENSPVFLRIWFNDGATGFQQLSPDQQIAAVGYAMMSANVPDGLITEGKLANGAVTSAKLADDAVTAAKLADDAVTTANLAPESVGATQLMDNAVGSDAVSDSLALGAPGIDGLLEVYSTSADTPGVIVNGGTSSVRTYGSDGLPQIELTGTSYGVISLHNSEADNSLAARLSANGSSGGLLQLYNTNGFTRAQLRGLNAGGDLTLYQADGNVGVFLDADLSGSGYMSLRDTNGNSRVQLYGTSTDTGTGGQILVDDDNGTRTVALEGKTSSTRGGALRLFQDNGTIGAYLEGETADGGGGALRFYNTAGDQRVYLSGDSGDAGYLLLSSADGQNGIFLDGDSGGAGLAYIYNASNAVNVVLDGQSNGSGGEVELRDNNGTRTVQILGAEDNATGGEITLYQADGTLTVELDGEAGAGNGGWLRLFSGDGSTAITLDADDATGVGRVTTQVLQITGGSDLSEQFDVKSAEQEVRPGMLVSIDSDHPGRLVVSSRAYDRTAAGVISGANGVHTGMIMGQEGSLANGKYPVALTGRVYCLVDADQGGAIRPGDLITTSDTPGHGMKVGDHAKAQGAIIGKAMTKLDSGRGEVLVLVSLQ